MTHEPKEITDRLPIDSAAPGLAARSFECNLFGTLLSPGSCHWNDYSLTNLDFIVKIGAWPDNRGRKQAESIYF